MGLSLRIADDAGIDTTNSGSMELIAFKDVDSFLSAAQSLNVGIIGIEGFHISGSQVIPDMGAIADFSELFSGEEIVIRSIEEARRFVLQFSQQEMFFDFEMAEVNTLDGTAS